MARGKNAARRRSSLDESNVVSMNQQKPTVSRQEVLDGIQYHWKNLSMKLHDFIMGNLLDLSLLKFINFWRNQQEGKSKTIAGASCGCSWYMALQYMIIGQVPEAKALIMNGCFLQQICVSALSCDFFIFIIPGCSDLSWCIVRYFTHPH